MLKFLPAYILVIIAMFSLDLIWLSQIAQPLYQAGIGHLMATEPRLGFAALFYLVFVFGLMWFAVRPNVAAKGLKSAFIAGAVFGFFVYASYDLTNLALLKDWPLNLSLIDMTWGTVLSATCAAVGKFVFDKSNKV
ncbi:MAG: DUF2177 family protein [Bdellovibrio sp.]|nr:DUF2177 family protein [Methylotenera sp.]